MIEAGAVTIIDYRPQHRPVIRRILNGTGWAEQYIAGHEAAAKALSQDRENGGVFLAVLGGEVVGYLFVQHYAWNRLCQIQGLAVSPEARRQGAASALVTRAEEFARAKRARGVYVDTPVTNTGGRMFYEAIGYRLGYVMPRYYEDSLDGVTYQKFFDGAGPA